MDGQRASGTSGSRPEEEEGADMLARAVSIGRERRTYPFGSGNDGRPRSNVGLGQIGSPWPFPFPNFFFLFFLLISDFYLFQTFANLLQINSNKFLRSSNI
jgi:hypothetical protein